MARGSAWRGGAPALGDPSDPRTRAGGRRPRPRGGLAAALLAGLIALVVVPAAPASAVPGDLDPAFGDHGWVGAPFSSSGQVYMAGYDGEQVVLGGDAISLASGGLDFAFARLDGGGHLDPSYGRGGRFLLDTPTPVLDFVAEKAIGGGFLPDGSAEELAWELNQSAIEFHLTKVTPDGGSDRSFGTKGTRVFYLPWAIGVPQAVTMDDQGRMYVIFSLERQNGFVLDLGLTRLKADGSLDRSFGTNGLAVANFDRQDVPNAVAVDSAGRIVVAGSTYDDRQGSVDHRVILARFTSGGQLDPAFGGDGMVETSFGTDSEAWSVGFDPQGRVLVGLRSDFSAGAARYSSGGVLDGGFGAAGLAALPVDVDNSFYIRTQGIASAPSGGIYVLGLGVGAFVERFTAGGDPDSSWDDDGLADVPNMDEGRVLLIRSGLPTVAGETYTIDGRPVGTRMSVSKLDAQGHVVTSYGDHGLATAPFYSTEGGEGAEAAVAAPGGGAYAAVGMTLTLPTNAWGVVKLGTDGRPDPSFGDDGRAVVPSLMSVGPAGGLGVMPDGDVLLASSDNQTEILRFTPSGQLDTTWGGGDGILTSDAMPQVDGLAVRDDGGFYVAGETIGPNGVQRMLSVARFDADGSPVDSFGTNGVWNSTLTSRSEFVSAMVLDAAGRPNVLFTTSSKDGGATDIGLLRLTASGEPDDAFGTGGRFLAGLQSKQAQAGGLALDGTRLVVSGFECHGPCSAGEHDALALRVTSNGALDATFGGGIRSVDFGGDDSVSAVTVDAQGRVVVGGSTFREVNFRDTLGFAAARFLPDGALDGGFGLHGIMRQVPPSTYAGMSELVPQSNGDILAVGGGLSEGVVATRLLASGAGIGRRDVLVQSRSVAEGDTGRKQVGIRLRLSAPLGVPATIYPFVDGGTADFNTDFRSLNPTVKLAPGATTTTYTVTVIGDRRIERDETVRITISPDDHDELVQHHGTLTIRNDD